MASKKISQLTAVAAPLENADILAVVDNSADETKKIGFNAAARGAISENAAGLSYDSNTGVLSLTAGYVIPTTTEESNWNEAYGWGNHAGLYDLVGSASGLIVAHELAYDHTLIATALQSETDPLSLHLNQTAPQTLINGIPLLSSTRVINANQQLVDKQYVDLAVSALQLTEYFTASALSPVVAGYYKMCTDLPTFATITSAAFNYSVNPTELFKFLTSAGEPGLDRLPAGTYSSHFHIYRATGNKEVQVYFELWKMSAAGAEVSKLGTSSTTAFFGDGVAQIKNIQLVLVDEITLVATDRLAIKWFAYTEAGGSNISVALEVGGTQDSNFGININPLELKNIFVPYTGAKSNVNLGVRNFLTTGTLGAGAITGTSLNTSSLLLGSGSVINWNSGDITLTHSANTLTFAGMDLLNLATGRLTSFRTGAGGSSVDASGFNIAYSGTSSTPETYTISGLSNAITDSFTLTGDGQFQPADIVRKGLSNGVTASGDNSIKFEEGTFTEANFGISNTVFRTGTQTADNFTITNYGMANVISDQTKTDTGGVVNITNYGGHFAVTASTANNATGSLTRTSYGFYAIVTGASANQVSTGYGAYISVSGNDTNWGFYNGSTGASLSHNMFGAAGINSSFGTTAVPTAKIMIGAGTAAAGTAPMKITPGTVNTTPESGAIESDGTNLYWVDSGGTRRQLNN